MTFGDVALDAAEGAILAHSVRVEDGQVRKGTVLDADDLARIRASGRTQVTVARLGPGDLGEDAAAERIGHALAGPGLYETPPRTGRVNILAERAGLVRVDADRIHALNRIDEGLTLATLADLARVEADQLLATVKIIPYGLSETVVAEGEAALGTGALTLLPFRPGRVRLVLTRTPGLRESLLEKGREAVAARVASLGLTLESAVIVPHEADAVARALAEEADITLILGASATSDAADVAPLGLLAAGGVLRRFGMPVDPGNLLFLGDLRGKPVVGLPGCARSPALNGVDWVLERLAAGLEVTGADIAAMGVGGLLKEMPGRPEPRNPRRE